MRKAGVICERQGKYTQALRWYGRGLTAAEKLEEPMLEAEGDLALAYAGVRFRQGRLRDLSSGRIVPTRSAARSTTRRCSPTARTC